MICNNCHQHIPDDSQKCPFCGSKPSTSQQNDFDRLVSYLEELNNAPTDSTYSGKVNKAHAKEYVGKKKEEPADTSYRGGVNKSHARESVGARKTEQADTSYRGGVNSNHARESVRPEKTAQTDTSYRGGVNKAHAKETVNPKKEEQKDTSYRGNVNKNYAKETVNHKKTEQEDTTYRGGANAKYSAEHIDPNKKKEPPKSEPVKEKTAPETPPVKETPKAASKPYQPQEDPFWNEPVFYEEKWYERLWNGFKNLNIVAKVCIIAIILSISSFVIDSHYSNQEKAVVKVQETLPPAPTIQTSIPKATQPKQHIVYGDEYMLHYRNKGFCKNLRGEIGIYFIFLHDDESYWLDEDIDTFMQDAYTRLDYLEAEARRWSVSLSFKTEYERGAVSGCIDSDNKFTFYDSIMLEKGLENTKSNTMVCDTLGTPQGFVAFVANKNGRAASICNLNDDTINPEYVFLFKDAYALVHEMCHLFGAEDYYYTEDMENYANTCLPYTIMLNHDTYVMDPLTAYLVGWIDGLTEDANKFLNYVSKYTEKDLIEAGRNNSFTGYKKIEKDEYTYEGYLLNGFFHDHGSIRWKNGDAYEGQFDNGIKSGYGTFYWANGDIYEGQFDENGSRTGYGSYYWANGDKYEGYFLNEQLHGEGKYTYANGHVVTGTWKNGNYIG